MSRTNKTKELLAQSLTELMVTTPLEKISVNDIVEHAGVGRNTFYYHFEDKFDLVNWYFQSGATQFLVTRGHYASWSTLLTDLEEYLLQNKTFYVNALAYTGQNCLQEYVFHYLSEMFGQRLLSLVPSATERDCQFTGNFLSGAMVGLLLPWVRNGMPPLNQADLDHGLRTLCSCNLAVLLGYAAAGRRCAGRFGPWLIARMDRVCGGVFLALAGGLAAHLLPLVETAAGAVILAVALVLLARAV